MSRLCEKTARERSEGRPAGCPGIRTRGPGTRQSRRCTTGKSGSAVTWHVEVVNNTSESLNQPVLTGKFPFYDEGDPAE